MQMTGRIMAVEQTEFRDRIYSVDLHLSWQNAHIPQPNGQSTQVHIKQ
uniref:Uncharacterized protein n=1 Tax=Arundo donax TaxID=35708 RepID=A0A0A9DUH3_ARUDO